MDDPIFVPAHGLAMALRRREVSSSEVVGSLLLSGNINPKIVQ